MKNLESIIESYYATEKRMCMEEPFYGMLIMNLNKTFDKIRENKTACVYTQGINFALDINSDYWEGLNKLGEDAMMGCLKHEMMHLCFFHFDSAYDQYRAQDKNKLNIAMDLSINCYLPKKANIVDITYYDIDCNEHSDQLELVNWNKFQQMYNLEPYKDALYYYNILESNEDKAAEDHNFGDGYDEDMSETKKQLVRNQVEYLIKNVVEQVKKDCGKIPNELDNIIEMLYQEEEAKFDWKTYLKQFCTNAVTYNLRKTNRRMSKRFPDNEGLKKKRHCRVCVLPDTSGSVSDDELKEFLNEFVEMKRRKATVDIACFDTKVYEPFRLNNDYKIEISGRGGTDFEQATSWCIEHRKDYDCFVIFTDGYDTIPDEQPKNLLWVLSSKTGLTPDNFDAKPCIKLED